MLMFLSLLCMAVCPSALNENNTGVIYSPGFPNHYPKNAKCFWTIGNHGYDHLVLNFTLIDLENSCHDKVIVKDGRYTWSTKLGEYCQGTKKTPFVVTPTGRFARVEFTSDSVGTGKGFLMFYKFLQFPYTTSSPTTERSMTHSSSPWYTTRGNDLKYRTSAVLV